MCARRHPEYYLTTNMHFLHMNFCDLGAPCSCVNRNIVQGECGAFDMSAISLMASAIVQIYAADVLKKAAQDHHSMDADDRQTLLSFFSSSSEYAPQSGQLTGTLKTMQDREEKSARPPRSSRKSSLSWMCARIRRWRRTPCRRTKRAVNDMGPELLHVRR